MQAEATSVSLQGYALSSQQWMAWAAVHGRRGAPACHAVAGTLPRSSFQPGALRQRLLELMERVEVFRTRYVLQTELSEPVQIVLEPEERLVRIVEQDWTSVSPLELPARKQQQWRQILATPVECGISALVALLPSDSIYLILAVAPLSADHTSLLRLLAAAAEATEKGSADPIQYIDVAAWQAELNEAEDAHAGRRFWQQAASMGDAHVLLAFDRGAAPTDVGAPEVVRHPLNAELAERVREQAQRWQMSEEDFYFASWAFLLQAMSNGQLPRLSRSFSSASHPSVVGCYGLFDRQLPLALDPAALTADRAGLAQLASACARMHELEIFFQRTKSGPAPYAFQYLKLPELRGCLDELRCVNDSARVRAVATIGPVAGSQAGLLALEYLPEAMSERAARLICEQWADFIAAMTSAGEPFRWQASDRRQRQLLDLGRGRQRSLAGSQTVLAQLEASAAEGRGVIIDDGRIHSLGDVNRRANRLARQLRSLGIGAGTIVGLCLPRSVDYVVAMLGALKSGAAYMPMDRDYPAARLVYMVESAAPALIITTPPATAIAADVPTRSLQELEQQAATLPHTAIEWDVRGSDAAYVLYTSGSTGKPKGVVINHRALANHMRWMMGQFEFQASDIFLQRTSASFDASVWELWAPLLAGGCIVIARQDKTYDLAYLVDLIRSQRVAVAQFVPSMLDLLLQIPEFAQIESLRLVFAGGEALGPALRQRFFERTRAQLCNLYGPTEACIDATFKVCTPADEAKVTIGRPIDNTSVHVLDERGELCGFGIAGEICIAGAGLFDGYLHRDELTAEKVFVPPFAHEKYYRTGDRGRVLESGEIEYLGRLDHQVKLHGYRIELGEIDRALEAQSGVLRAVTIVARDTQLAAMVQVDARSFSSEAVLEALRRQLPHYMVPTRLVALDRWPTLPNGKLDRARLHAIIDQILSTPEYAAPESTLQRRLTEIWSKVLKRERIGIHDKFFSIGGDSIRSIQLVYEAGRVGLSFTVMDIFEHQTIAALAEHLRTRARAGAADTRELTNPVSLTLRTSFADAYPATQMQQYMLEAYAADTARSGTFHVQQCFRVSAPGYDRQALCEAVAAACDAPNFRTRFVAEGQEIYQVLASAPVTPQVVDLISLSPGAQEQRIRAALEQDCKNAFDPFDISTPLARILLFELSESCFELAMSNHHAIQDGWGNVEFLNRLSRTYAAACRGQSISQPADGNVCKEHALLQYALVRDPQQERFWRTEAERLAALHPVELAVSGHHHIAIAELDAPLAASLTQVSQAHNVTMKAILLTAYLATLRSLGLAAVVGVVSNGRSEALSDSLGAMGLFWNLLPFAMDESAEAAAGACARVQARLVQLEPFAKFPLRRIEQLAAGRRLFSATFNFVHFHNQLQSQAEGGFDARGTHALDNFGFALQLTVGVTAADGVVLRLQADAALPWNAARVREEWLRQLRKLVCEPQMLLSGMVR